MSYATLLQHADELIEIFGRGRVFFDKEIRQLYNHDLSNPPWIIDFLIKREPDAVVVAQNRDQVVRLLKFATAYKIPVTPAAGRTSGYGGALPTKGGIVVDLNRLNKNVTVDAANLTVTTDPSVVILDLERELGRHGVALATYPTSAPSATIAGFVCQGGVGMGSFRHGPVANQVLAAEIVLPTGEVRTFTGNELDMVNECEGITGIVTQLTLRVVKKTERVPALAAFDSADAMVKALKVVAERFRPWNITFHNPTFSQLREEAGGPKTVPRKKWSILAVFDAPDWAAAKADFTAAIEQLGGKLLPDATAQADWGEIFNTLRAKALGPSLAPGEAVFPLDRAGEVLAEIEKKFAYAALSMEGTVLQGGNVTLLAFALEDERRPEYALGFAAGMGVLGAAKRAGGRAYASGLYLAAEAPELFGDRRYRKLVAFKKAVDRSNIMNPGKILGAKPRAKAWLLGIPAGLPAPQGAPMSTVDRVLNAKPMVWLMSKVAPLVKYNRPAEDRAARPAMWKAISAVQGSSFGQKHDWNVYTCSQCMFCRNASPLTDAVGFEAGSPSGLIWWARLYLKGELQPTRKVAEMVAAAAEVPVGDDVCPSRIPLSQVFRDWKIQLESDHNTTFVVPEALKARIEKSKAEMEERKKRWATPAAAPSPPAAPGATEAKKPATAATPAKPAIAKPVPEGPKPAPAKAAEKPAEKPAA